MKQSLKVLVGLLLAASPHAEGQLRTVVPQVATPVPEATVFSRSLRFEGKVVEQLADGRSIREVAYLRAANSPGRAGRRCAAPARSRRSFMARPTIARS